MNWLESSYKWIQNNFGLDWDNIGTMMLNWSAKLLGVLVILIITDYY